MTIKLPPKTERLKLLSEFTDRVPATLNLEEAAAAIEAKSLIDRVWYLRGTSNLADDRYKLAERTITTSVLMQKITELRDKNDYVLQEYVEPLISGVAYISKAILLEAIRGGCDPLLRHGATGYRLGVSRAGGILWTNFGSDVIPRGVLELIKYIVELMKDSKATKILKGALLEWIVNPQERLYLVDYKKPGINFLKNDFVKAPNFFYIYGAPSSSVHLPKTSIEYLNTISQLRDGLVFNSGSPLSHICVEAFYQKIPVSVPNVLAGTESIV